MSRRRIQVSGKKDWLVSLKQSSAVAHKRLIGRFIPAKMSLRRSVLLSSSMRLSVSTSDLLYQTWPPFDSDNFATDSAQLLRNLPVAAASSIPRARAYSEGAAAAATTLTKNPFYSSSFSISSSSSGS